MKKLRADSIQGLLVTFVFSFVVKDNKDLTHRELLFCLLFDMDVELGLLRWKKNCLSNFERNQQTHLDL
jgi:hypothetical protein